MRSRYGAGRELLEQQSFEVRTMIQTMNWFYNLTDQHLACFSMLAVQGE
jgi:hypothetical protein